MILGEPTLMRVLHARIVGRGDGNRVVLVRHIRDGERRLVRIHTDLAAGIVIVRSVVDHALRVVRVARVAASRIGVGETAREDRTQGIVDVNHVRPAPASHAPVRGTDEVGEPRLLVDGHIVRGCDFGVEDGRLELARLGHVTQLCEVEHLHAVLARAVGHDEGVVLEDLDVAPGAWRAACGPREVAQVAGVVGIADVHERRPVHPARQGVLPPRQRIRPAPHVVEPGTPLGAHLLARQEGQQVDVVAVVAAGGAVVAGDLATADGGEGRMVDREYP